MALTDAYATAAEYRGVIDKTDTKDDTEILSDLKAISRYLEGKLGRFFNKDASAVARIYMAPSTTRTLWVTDMSEAPVTVKFDYDGDGVYETATTNYKLLPFNAPVEPEPQPYTRIYFDSHLSKGQMVEITAKYGWPAVPEAIKKATIHLTAILRLETPRATRRIQELGETIEASTDAQSIIRQLTDNYQLVSYR